MPWDSFAQRPHQFVKCYHKATNNKVIWIEPYPVRLPRWSDLRRVMGSTDKHTGTDAPEWLSVVRVSALPIEPLPVVSQLNHWVWRSFLQELLKRTQGDTLSLAIGKPCRLALLLMKRLSFVSTLYDAMDNFPHFSTGLSRVSVSQVEQLIVAAVDHVITSSHSQLDRLQSAKKLTLIPNACDMTLVQQASAFTKPSSSVVVGYVGTIGEWFDWALVVQMAKQNPQCLFRLIGPVFQPSPYRLPDNIELKGACTHEVAIKEMLQFSVALIPFKLNDLTQSVDPIKYYEYRALGIPIVSTKFGEMLEHARYGGVTLILGLEDCSVCIDAALGHNMGDKAIELFRNENSWENRFEQLDKIL
ncbi:MAG: hypothetical protein ACRCV6_01230 [Formosimonas sp.]